MFYLGSHKGTPDDGYVGSSKWLKSARLARKLDFKRRIIEVLPDDSTLDELRSAEQRWLNMMKDSELGVRYFNLKKRATGWKPGIWTGKKQKPETVARRVAVTTGQKRPKQTEAMLGSKNPFYGKKHSEGMKKKLREMALFREEKKRNTLVEMSL